MHRIEPTEKIINENTEIFLDFIDIIKKESSDYIDIKNFIINEKEVFQAFISVVLSLYITISFGGNDSTKKIQIENLHDLLNAFPILKKCVPIYSELINIQILNPVLSKTDCDFKQQEISAIFSYKY